MLLNLLIAALATTAPIAHVVELPNKLRMDGGLWLAVQQQLYRGWGSVYGPVEILALATSVALAFLRRKRPDCLRPTLAAVLLYAGMIAVFFVFNAPVNHAFQAWTPATLPADWPAYRIRWEGGHALAALLSVIALGALVLAFDRERGSPRA